MAFKNRFGIDRVHEFYGASEGNSAFVNIFNFDKTCGWAPGSNKTWAVVEYDIAEDELAYSRFNEKMAVGETGLLIMKVNEQYPFDGYTDQQASEKKLFRNVFEPAIAGSTAATLLRASHSVTFNLLIDWRYVQVAGRKRGNNRSRRCGGRLGRSRRCSRLRGKCARA